MGDCTGKCNGACCTDFVTRFSKEEFQRMSDALKNGIHMIARDCGFEMYVPQTEDLHYIADMLIPLGTTDIDPMTGENLGYQYCKKQMNNPESEYYKILKDDNSFDSEHKSYPDVKKLLLNDGYVIGEDNVLRLNHFTCKHFNTETKLCNDYENRPAMCRAYPINYGRGNDKCGYSGCTLNCG